MPRRQHRARAHRRLAGLFLVLAVGLAAACGDDSSGGSGEPARTVSGGEPAGPADEGIEGVEAFEVTTEHTDDHLAYEPSPPAGGDHSQTPATCGFYDSDPPLDQHIVHSIEHGAIWIAYDPDLPEAEIDTLRGLTGSQAKVIVTPYEGLDSPLVVTAWARQLALDSADDPRLARFIEQYESGGESPEPGAPCLGTGEPAVAATG